jgi:DNA (cytosine-5)-methyltransferase 1
MTAIVQGFPKNWKLAGRKTSAYKQVGNAFPPPVAAQVGTAISNALLMVPIQTTVTTTDDEDEDASQIPAGLVSSEAPAAL